MGKITLAPKDKGAEADLQEFQCLADSFVVGGSHVLLLLFFMKIL